MIHHLSKSDWDFLHYGITCSLDPNQYILPILLSDQIHYTLRSKPRTIRRNTKHKLWFYSQAIITILLAMIGIYFIVNSNSSPLVNDSTKYIRTVAYIFPILYAGIIGLSSVCTLSVGFCGDYFCTCFNVVIRQQRHQHGDFNKVINLSNETYLS